MVQQTNTTVRQIEFGSADYDETCALRHAVLRAPLGLSLYAEDLEKESRHLHFALHNESGRLIACAVAAPLESGCVRIQQMAVAEGCRRAGAGRRLMQHMESTLTASGVTLFLLHARVSAVPFYQKLGYRVTSDTFTEVGIPHVRMEKTTKAPARAPNPP